jgi:outer membrane protein assembly factor BamB
MLRKIKKIKSAFLFTVLIGIVTIFVVESNAQNSPQWRGANRDGVWSNTGIVLDFTKNKPPMAWVFREAGEGYSSPAIVGNTLYCQGTEKSGDFAFALDTQTGKLKWKQTLGELFVQDRGNGPRGSVTVDGDKLYLIRGGGQIHCLSATDGKKLWQKDFRKDFGGNIMSRQDWGFSESPLVDGNLVICTPGGNKGTMIALDKNSGAVVWQSKEWTDLGGYSSPIVAEVAGVRQYIQTTRQGVAGIAAKTGKLLWSANVAGNNVAVVPTPVYRNNIVYVTSGYNAGCGAIRLTKKGNNFRTEVLYSNKDVSNHHGGVVLVGDHIYGYSDASGWVCQDFKTGKIIWKNRIQESGKGAVISIDNRLLLQNERDGALTVIEATPAGWKEHGRMEFPERSQAESMDKMVWTHPVLANGKLYLRDHNLLFCYELKK